MRGKSRARGEREPKGRIKAEILLFVAGKGGPSFTEIREHLSERFNIRSQKNIRNHLDELSDANYLNILDKTNNGIGLPCSYRIRDSIDGQRRLFNYLRDHGLERELMRTDFFILLISSKDFFRKIKTMTVSGMMTEFYDRLGSEEGIASMAELLEHVPAEDRELLVAWIRRVGFRDRDDPLSRSFVEMVESEASMSVEDIMGVQDEALSSGRVRLFDTKELESLTQGLLVPDGYREQLTTILRLSPSAYNSVMNLDCRNPLFPTNPFLAYAISLRLAEAEIKDHDVVSMTRCCEYSAKVQRITTEPPIFIIARSLFVSDLVCGRLTDTVNYEVMRSIFTPLGELY